MNYKFTRVINDPLYGIVFSGEFRQNKYDGIFYIVRMWLACGCLFNDIYFWLSQIIIIVLFRLVDKLDLTT